MLKEVMEKQETWSGDVVFLLNWTDKTSEGYSLTSFDCWDDDDCRQQQSAERPLLRYVSLDTTLPPTPLPTPSPTHLPTPTPTILKCYKWDKNKGNCEYESSCKWETLTEECYDANDRCQQRALERDCEKAAFCYWVQDKGKCKSRQESKSFVTTSEDDCVEDETGLDCSGDGRSSETAKAHRG
eukprot:TRINITY_DN517_c0_g1_i1.p2 TRINITY_DN517_c0_g1~~TRINITY_DN517_c0_g1_i1.p2  ORF type:complete len:184 (-),score=40.60 TRINITY_DN517_c0_g1_i1:2-553(-)